MRSTPAAVLCIEAVPTADLDPAGAAALGRRVAEQIVAPTVRLHGGRTDGVLGTRIVASFPDSETARRGAEAVLSVAEWDLDDAALRMGLSTDPDGAALPSAAAVARAARRCAAAPTGSLNGDDGSTKPIAALGGAALPLAGAGLATMRWWTRSPEAAAATMPAAEDPPPVDPPVLADPEPSVPETIEPPAGEPDETEPIPEATEEPDLQFGEVLLFFTTPEQEAVAIDSLERFAAAGLELPDGLEVHFHDDAEACGGHALAIAVHAEGFERVDMCTGHDFTLRHELAHIWAREHLDEATRAEFLEARGLDTWASTDQPWDRRGSEHLAHIIAWGLGDTPIRLGEIPDADFESLTEGFHLLTGRLPLHDVATSPEPDDDWSGVGLLRRSSGSPPLEAAAFEASAPLADAETAPFGAPPVEVWEPVDETDPLAAMPGPLDADEAPGDPDDTDDEEDDDLEAF